jgi:putative DNA methylase
MIPKECKRLAEVDFPIAIVSQNAAREKSIRQGHPSTLHLWWARRPLAACRAMLLALLLPDPCDENCPAEFKERARLLLPKAPGMGGIGPRDENLRAALLKFIGDFSNWDLSSNQTYLEVSRGLVKAAHDETPLVVDPFAGGGSIPLEALRLDCDAFASDLNPVACLILKTMLEDIPRHGAGLAEELRRVSKEIKAQAEGELSVFYPVDPDGAKPIAYLWARTVRCEQPDCGAEIPLVRTTWLAKRYNKSKKIYTKLVSLDILGDKTTKTVQTAISVHDTPTSKLPSIAPPTISNGKAMCPCCQRVLGDVRVRSQLREHRGGSDTITDENGNRISGARLMAVILRKRETGEVIYRLPNKADRTAIKKCHDEFIRRTRSSQLPLSPSEPINPIRPSPNARGVSGATRIGITDFGLLFTTRQKLSLGILSILASAQSLEPSVQLLLSLAITKLAERSSSFVTWINSTEAPRGTFARQSLTIAWDFLELVPVVDDEEFPELIDAMLQVAAKLNEASISSGQVQQADATTSPLPDESVSVWFTDPPYYDSIPYADLADFFYVWLKRIPLLSDFLSKLATESNEGLTPKVEECTWNQAHIINGSGKTPAFFEMCVARAFGEGRRVLMGDGLGCVVFAHKSTEGWEALLSGMMRAGWVIIASWPVKTERGARLNAKESAALATSVHLVCRPRTEDAIGDWGDVLRELPKRVGDWMERLQVEGVRGADLVFACIGPALEIFSRFSRVETAEGDEITLAQYLEKVWEVVGRSALERVLGTAEAKARNGAAGALEEDSRLTALFLWTMQSTNTENANGADAEDAEESEDEMDDEEEAASSKKAKGFSLPFDVVRRFAQPLGIHLPEWEGRIVETKKGVVQLLAVGERAKHLFGEDGARTIADRIESEPAIVRTDWLPGMEPAAEPLTVKGRKDRKPTTTAGGEVSDETLQKRHIEQRGATTLDRVHAAMLLQSGGRANALRALLKAEVERGPDFMRLANALTALYPTGSEEKRLLEAMLLAAPK